MTGSVWSALGDVWSTLWPIIVALLIFGLIVVIHEFGHFFFAKLFKVKVNEFAVGFGPALYKKQKGETLYAIRLVPFGGFCSMEGEDEHSDQPGAFHAKKPWKRFIIVAAGAVNNLILGFLLVAIMLGVRGEFNTTTVQGFVKDASSYQSGLRAGDEIVEVDGRSVYCASDLSYMMMTSQDDTLSMVVNRDGEEITLNQVKFPMKQNEQDGKTYLAADFGIVREEMTLSKPLDYIGNTAMETVSIGRVVWMSLVDLVGGRFSLNDMMGPVGVVSTVSDSVSQAADDSSGAGMEYLLYLLAMITINLGIVNLLPLPALDGGRLVFITAEGIFRKPIPQKFEGWVHAVGFALLIGLILIICGNDILRLIRG